MRKLIIEKEIFKFEELSDSAKENARQWWRDCENVDPSYADFVMEDVKAIGDIIGIDFDGSRKRGIAIYYSGFASQGDGACFEGHYFYVKGCLKGIKEYAPTDLVLHGIVKNLLDIQKANFYQLRATTKHSGYYYHSGCMTVDVERVDGKEMTVNAEDDITQILREFANWIYKRLEMEYDYVMSDENVDESIIINEYEFDIDGNII